MLQRSGCLCESQVGNYIRLHLPKVLGQRILGWSCPVFTFQSWIQDIFEASEVINYFLLYNLFPSSLSLGNILMCFIPSVQTFTVETCHGMSTWTDHPIKLPSYSISKKEDPFGQLLPENYFMEYSQMDISPITTILASLSLGLTVILPTYLHKMHFLLAITSFRKKIYFEWLLSPTLGEN